MTPRQKFIPALEGKQPSGRVPHFELVFFLTMEAFGRIHPQQRGYWQWEQMSEDERKLHRRDIADLYVATAQKYEHSAIFFHAPGGVRPPFRDDEILRTLDDIRRPSIRAASPFRPDLTADAEVVAGAEPGAIAVAMRRQVEAGRICWIAAGCKTMDFSNLNRIHVAVRDLWLHG